MDLSDPRLGHSADQLDRYRPWACELAAALAATSRDDEEKDYWAMVMVVLLARERQGVVA